MNQLSRIRFAVVLGCLLFLGCEPSGASRQDKRLSETSLNRPDPPEPSIWLTRATLESAGSLETQDHESLNCRGRNLIFISIDALQAAHVSSLGYPRTTTPTLDAFALQSYQFSHCYSVASWTVPASMSWFTGVYPTEHRIVNKYAVYSESEQEIASLDRLAPKLITLAEVLQSQGYRTAGFTGNAGVSRSFGYGAGFEVYDHETAKFGTFDFSIPQAVRWLESHGSEPFFLFLQGYDAHGQAMPIGGFDYRFADSKYDRRYSGAPQEQEYLREEGLDRGVLELRSDDIEFWRDLYDEKIQRADAKLETFFRELDRLGLLDKTLIVVTSDHGTEFCEHGRFDHGFTLYDEQIHVPLWIHLPGQRTSRAISERVSSISLMPTLLELLELELAEDLREQMRGQSLVGVMRGESKAESIFSETDYREMTFKRSVISPEGWKLIYTLESRERELFDLNHDPQELNDLAEQHPAMADALETQIFEHYQTLGHDLRARVWQPGYNPVYSFPTNN